MPTSPPRTSWISGPSKWAAIVVLGAASIAGVAWTMGRGGQVWRPTQAAAAPPTPAAPLTTTPPPAQALTPPAPTPSPTTNTTTTPDPKPTPPVPAAPTLRKLININTAGQGELELLPGVGPKLAQRIIEYRTTKGPFKRIDDLDAVKGIGPKTMARLHELITVE